MGLGKGRFEINDPPVPRDCIIPLPHDLKGICEIEDGIHIIRLQSNRCLVVVRCLFEPAPQRQGKSEIVVRKVVGRLYPDCSAENRYGILPVANLIPCDPSQAADGGRKQEPER